MSRLGKTRREALRKFAEQFPEQIPPEGLLLSYRWGSTSARGRVYVKLTLLQSGEVEQKTSSRIYQPELTKELDLSFIPDSIWLQFAKDRFM